MNRAIFPAVTIVLSGLVFAGVWTMTGPAAAGVSSIAAAAPVVEATAETLPDPLVPVVARRRTIAMRRALPAAVPRIHRVAPRQETASTDIFYSGCREVRAAGAAPLYRGQPGYRQGMDGDNDGIACEPYRGS